MLKFTIEKKELLKLWSIFIIINLLTIFFSVYPYFNLQKNLPGY